MRKSERLAVLVSCLLSTWAGSCVPFVEIRGPLAFEVEIKSLSDRTFEKEDCFILVVRQAEEYWALPPDPPRTSQGRPRVKRAFFYSGPFEVEQPRESGIILGPSVGWSVYYHILARGHCFVCSSDLVLMRETGYMPAPATMEIVDYPCQRTATYVDQRRIFQIRPIQTVQDVELNVLRVRDLLSSFGPDRTLIMDKETERTL